MKLQKIMIDAGFTCPNRDGKVGVGGCTFCRTDSFSPSYCQGSITEQLEAGKRFFLGKYPAMQYLAYFQSYSNTYAPASVLKERYEEALAVPDVVGLVIGTRPDCLGDDIIDYLAELNRTRTSVTVEIGVESFSDVTLKRINRGHDSQTSLDAIRRCAQAGLPVCIHLIIGLPGEKPETILQQTALINSLPIQSIKLHQLQILRGTAMEQEWLHSPQDFPDLSLTAYVQLVAQFVSQLRHDIHVERMASSAPSSLLIHPRWGLKPAQVEEMIRNANVACKKYLNFEKRR